MTCTNCVRLLRVRNDLRARIPKLKDAIRELLGNKGCSCGGWKCARCKLAIREARAALKGK